MHFSQVILLDLLLVYLRMVMLFHFDMVVSSHIVRKCLRSHQDELGFNDTSSQMLMLSNEKQVHSRSSVSIRLPIKIRDQKAILAVSMLVSVVQNFVADDLQKYIFLLRPVLKSEKLLLFFAKHELVRR